MCNILRQQKVDHRRVCYHIYIYLGGGFKYFLFSTWAILTNMFQTGWNHQLDMYIQRTYQYLYRHTVDGKTSCKTSWYDKYHIIFSGFWYIPGGDRRISSINSSYMHLHIYIYIMLFASEDQSGSYRCVFFVKQFLLPDPPIQKSNSIHIHSRGNPSETTFFCSRGCVTNADFCRFFTVWH